MRIARATVLVLVSLLPVSALAADVNVSADYRYRGAVTFAGSSLTSLIDFQITLGGAGNRGIYSTRTTATSSNGLFLYSPTPTLTSFVRSNGAAGANQNALELGTIGAYPLRFFTNSDGAHGTPTNERMAVSSDGDVGVGTSPSSSYRLFVRKSSGSIFRADVGNISDSFLEVAAGGGTQIDARSGTVGGSIAGIRVDNIRTSPAGFAFGSVVNNTVTESGGSSKRSYGAQYTSTLGGTSCPNCVVVGFESNARFNATTVNSTATNVVGSTNYACTSTGTSGVVAAATGVEALIGNCGGTITTTRSYLIRGRAVTNATGTYLYGLYLDDLSAGGTFTNRYNIWAVGDVPSYLGGNLGLAMAATHRLDVSGNARASGLLITTPGAITIPDGSNPGTPASYTLNPAASVVSLTCSDADGCAVTMGETSPVTGSRVTIVNLSANNCTFADTAGVSELAGAMTMAQYQTLSLIYVADRWIEVSRSLN